MSKREKILRQQLLDARAKILRQIDICQNNPVSNFYTAGGGEAPALRQSPNLRPHLRKLKTPLLI
jgi:hypothetical protein